MFTKVRTMYYPDRKCDLVEYVHSSGLRHFHLESSFPELSFALTLKTPSEDDTGTPHILEHLTLCGSQKYPVKDPFMAMSNRSLAHDLNAATGPLQTSYHFATTVEKDFLNLSDLYADLVFNPLLRQFDFEQEGWRFEHTEQGPKMKGVVLNEMKGAYSSSSMEAYIAMWNIVAPETPARFSFGGHPSAILGLTYDKIKDYHARFYTPENAVLTTAGNIPTQKLHAQLEEIIARRLKTATLPTHVPVSPKGLATPLFQQQGDVQFLEVCGPETDTCAFSMFHIFEGPKNAEEDMLDQAMVHVLFEQSDSVFKEIAKEEMVQIGTSYLFDVMMHVTGNASVSLDISNLPKHDIEKQEKVRNRVLEAYDKLGETVVTKEKWNAAVLAFEKSILGGIDESPRNDMTKLGGNILWGFDPLRNASNLPILEKFKNNPPTQDEIRSWVSRRFSTLPKWMKTVTSPHIPALWESYENRRVEEMVSEGVQPSQLEKAPPHTPDQLPTLNPEDVCCRFVDLDTKTTLRDNHPPHTHVEAVSQTGTISLFFNLKDFTMDEIGLLAILSKAKGLLGSKTLTTKQFRAKKEETGISTGYSVGLESNPDRLPICLFQATASGLNTNAHDLPKILEELCGVPVYEEQDWKNAFHQLHQSFVKSEERLKNAHASSSAHASYNPQANFRDRLVDFCLNNEEQCLETFIKHPEAALKQWQTLFDKILTQPSHLISVGGAEFEEQASVVQKSLKLSSSWEHLGQAVPMELTFPNPSGLKLIPTPQGVNHCHRAIPGPLWGTKDFAVMKVATEILSNILHEKIREEGGAYGSDISTKSGMISMSSFRDPHVEETFQVWDSIPSLYENYIKEFSSHDLQEAKLSIVKSFLVPSSSTTKAWEKVSDMFMGMTNDEREAFLKQIMEVSYADLADIAPTYFNPPKNLITDRATVPLNYELKPQRKAQAPSLV